MKAIPESYTGKCPATIKFEGEITVKGIKKPFKIQYKFIRSDGASAPIETLIFEKDGTKKVNTTWTLGGPGLPTYQGWEAIKIVYPQELESNKANFKIDCETKQTDLRIRISNCPKIAKPGQNLGASFQVTASNQGDTAVKDVIVDIILRKENICPAPTPVAVYSPNFSDGVLLKGGREHISLNAGQTANVKLNGTNTIPSDTPQGNYYLCAVIDAGDKIQESNEKNNCSCCPVQIRVISLDVKPEITGYRESCAKKGGNVTILGKNFGSKEGKGVVLGGHGIHVALTVVSWSDTIIVAQIPNDPKIQEGQWYYIGVEKADHSEWLSNINKNITICR